MYCARGVFLSVRLTPCCAVSYPYLPVARYHICNNSNVLGFWRVIKAIVLFNFFQEDDYV